MKNSVLKAAQLAIEIISLERQIKKLSDQVEQKKIERIQAERGLNHESMAGLQSHENELDAK